MKLIGSEEWTGGVGEELHTVHALFSSSVDSDLWSEKVREHDGYLIRQDET